MSRLDPRNREEAFAHQLQDDAKVLMPHALLGNQKSFEKQIAHMEATIKAYRSKRLRNDVAKTEKKYKESMKFLRDKFPSLYK